MWINFAVIFFYILYKPLDLSKCAVIGVLAVGMSIFCHKLSCNDKIFYTINYWLPSNHIYCFTLLLTREEQDCYLVPGVLSKTSNYLKNITDDTTKPFLRPILFWYIRQLYRKKQVLFNKKGSTMAISNKFYIAKSQKMYID
jgi:hypothetical protein